MNRKCMLLVLVIFVYFTCNIVSAQPWLVALKSSSVFISTIEGGYEYQGTCFIVADIDTSGVVRFPVYLVTAKHVLKNINNKWLTGIKVRLNRKNNDPVDVEISVKTEGASKNVFVHKDTTVDLAIITLPAINFGYVLVEPIPLNIFARRSDFLDGSIAIGEDLVYAGLFRHYKGEHNNIPIFRFGRISLIPEEAILIDGIRRELILIENMSMGGHSGSPVFVIKQIANLIPYQYRPVFVGVLVSGFNESADVVLVETAKTPKAFVSSGISAIVPSYILREIIDSVK